MLHSDISINSEYKYVDDDINTILDLRLKEEGIMQEGNGVFMHAPIGESEKPSFSAILENEQKIHPPNRILLLPYLLGHNMDGHWVGIVIQFEDTKVTTVKYYDSMSTSTTTIQNLESKFQKQYDDNSIKIEVVEDCASNKVILLLVGLA